MKHTIRFCSSERAEKIPSRRICKCSSWVRRDGRVNRGLQGFLVTDAAIRCRFDSEESLAKNSKTNVVSILAHPVVLWMCAVLLDSNWHPKMNYRRILFGRDCKYSVSRFYQR